MKKEHQRSFFRTDGEVRQRGRLTLWSHYRPLDTINDEPLLGAPGILAKRAAYESFAEELAQRGHDITLLAHPSASMVCGQEVADMARRIADEQQRQVRLLGHSLGAIHSTEAALLASDEISGITYMQPAGFGGVHPEHALQSVATSCRVSEIAQLGNRLATVKEGVEYALHGRRDLFATALKASRHKVISELGQLSSHMSHNAIVFQGDRLINTSELIRGLGVAGIEYAVLDIPKAGHNAQLCYPAATAELVSGMLVTDSWQTAV